MYVAPTAPSPPAASTIRFGEVDVTVVLIKGFVYIILNASGIQVSEITANANPATSARGREKCSIIVNVDLSPSKSKSIILSVHSCRYEKRLMY